MSTRTELQQLQVAITRGTWNTRVFAAVCAYYKIAGDELLFGGRARDLVDARHIAMWLMHNAGGTFASIGRELGYDHSTIAHGVRRVDRTPDLMDVAMLIRRALTGQAA
jgi:chromosomal replication initiation ATPase DnaA